MVAIAARIKEMIPRTQDSTVSTILSSLCIKKVFLRLRYSVENCIKKFPPSHCWLNNYNICKPKSFLGINSTHPHEAKEWGIENYLLGIGGPENYKFDSTKRAYWKCSKCSTRYKMPIDDYIIKGKRGHEPCWKCAGRMKNILKF